MPSAIVRQWLILSMLPAPPRRIDTATLEQRLRERGDPVHRRTIQRDLVQLSAVFPIVADERQKPFGWRWTGAAARPELLSIGERGPAKALTLRLRVARGTPRDAVESLGGRDMEIDGASGAVTCSVGDTPHLRAVLVALAGTVEVLGPAGLRGEIAALAERALRLYGGQP
jgi:predicted DNA-binding transcriptional regulator YafY